jgi:hypothetical protein
MHPIDSKNVNESRELFARARAEVESWPSWRLSYDVRADLQRLQKEENVHPNDVPFSLSLGHSQEKLPTSKSVSKILRDAILFVYNWGFDSDEEIWVAALQEAKKEEIMHPNEFFDDNLAMARVLARREEKLPAWFDEKMHKAHHDILLDKIQTQLARLHLLANNEEDGPIGSPEWQFAIKEGLSKLASLLSLMAAPVDRHG